MTKKKISGATTSLGTEAKASRHSRTKDKARSGARVAELVRSGEEAGILPGEGEEQVRRKLPKNHRKLARAIFAKCDAVTVGHELLQCESATVKARVWETLVNYALGEFAPAGGKGASGSVQIVWDMPGPAHEAQ